MMRAFQWDTQGLIKRYAKSPTIGNRLTLNWLKEHVKKLTQDQLFLAAVGSGHVQAVSNYHNLYNFFVQGKSTREQKTPTPTLSTEYIAANAATLYEQATGIKVQPE